MTDVQQAACPARVVVVGASLAGLFAAAACAGGGRTVTVVDRDVLPAGPAPRPGVPQGLQPHVLLYRGLLAMEELLPGLGQELRDAGAVEIDTGDLAWLGELGWSAYRSPQFVVLSATRPLLEHLVRRRVRQLPGVTVLDDTRVLTLRRGGDDWEAVTSQGVHHADLVVDASGRGSRLPVWLEAAGVTGIVVSEVDARTGYATRMYAAPPDRIEPAGVLVLQTPDLPRGGTALPVEGGHWLVCAVGSGAHRPPRDAEGYEAFLRGLRDPALAEVLDVARPVGDVAVHRQTGNRRHHYERVRRWPDGLLVVGDAFCTFNPVYGQGVAVAACEALELSRALTSGWRTGSERQLLRAFTRLTALPWQIATSQDLRLPSCDGSPSATAELTRRWTEQVTLLAGHGDRRAQWALARLYHLVAPPRVLLHPALLAAATRARVGGLGAPNPRPRIVAPAVR